MYGLSNLRRETAKSEPGSVTVLRSKGIGAVDQLNGSYLVAGTILWWPKQGYWKRDDDAFGYGLDGLMKAILPAASQ